MRVRVFADLMMIHTMRGRGRDENDDDDDDVEVAFWALSRILQISIQLHLFTKIRDFLHARCKKSLLDVKNNLHLD